MTLTIGTAVRVKDTYADPDRRKPVTGWVADILDFDGVDRYVVRFDKETMAVSRGHSLLGGSPGGEFSLAWLEALNV